jgi:hypothetical protein
VLSCLYAVRDSEAAKRNGEVSPAPEFLAACEIQGGARKRPRDVATRGAFQGQEQGNRETVSCYGANSSIS